MDFDAINYLLTDTEENSSQIQQIVDDIVNSNSSGLDELMTDIYTNIINCENPPLVVIEKAFIKLSNALYFIAPNVERLGIRDGISKISATQAYNMCFIDNKVDATTGKNRTAAELSALSEEKSKYEKIVNDAYNKAYKILKGKIENAQTMCATLSKVYSIRSATEASEDKLETKQMLNEVFN